MILVYIYIYIYVCLYVCIFIQIQTVSLYQDSSVGQYMLDPHAHAHTHTQTHTHMYMCVCVYIYIYIFVKNEYSIKIFIEIFFFRKNRIVSSEFYSRNLVPWSLPFSHNIGFYFKTYPPMYIYIYIYTFSFSIFFSGYFSCQRLCQFFHFVSLYKFHNQKA